MTSAFAEVDRLTLRHIGRRRPALNDLSLRWHEGERLLLLGPSGSGKSTLALCLNGIVPHSLDAHWESGTVRVGGVDTRDPARDDLTRRVGVVFQDPEAQLVTLEVDDEIAFGLENQALPRAEIVERVRAARAAMGLGGVRTPRRLAQLSGGTKQRVAVASVLAMEPRGLVLDEPTANLDPVGSREVARAVEALCAERDRSLLLIEHRLDDVLALIDRVLVLDAEGSLALEGPPGTVFGPHAPRLDALGVWVPQLAQLARLVGSDAVPRDRAAAARILAEHWPRERGRAARGPTPPPAGALLDARGVSFRYGASRHPALDGVDLSVAAGESLAIVGANGAGKSTLGLLLAGALPPAAGSILLGGTALARLDEREVRRRLAYVFQYPEHQFVARTVREELLVGLRRYAPSVGGVRARADELLQRFALDALADANPHSLSHGQKRRLSVATALVGKPELIILDEPTFGQDRRHTETLFAHLEELRRAGTAIVMITHDLALVADHADRAIALAGGAKVFDGDPALLLTDDAALARAGLARPPVAAAFALARTLRPDLPEITGLRAAAAYLR